MFLSVKILHPLQYVAFKNYHKYDTFYMRQFFWIIKYVIYYLRCFLCLVCIQLLAVPYTTHCVHFDSIGEVVKILHDFVSSNLTYCDIEVQRFG